LTAVMFHAEIRRRSNYN